MILSKVKRPSIVIALTLLGAVIFVLVAMTSGKISRINEPIAEQQPSETVIQQNPVQEQDWTIKMHTVAAGETLSEIAQAYNIDVDTLLGANPETGFTIYPGDQLFVLPQRGVLYTVVKDDTLLRIASLYHVEVAEIMTANKKADVHLAVGEKLFLPGAKPMELVGVSASRATAQRFSWPASGEISSPFGTRWGRLHAGIDIANDTGTAVTAALSGRVTYSGWYGGYGYAVMVEHGNGYVTLYGHLSQCLVESGQYVRTGQKIGLMGNTGYSTGPHLHFEVRCDDQPVNPMRFLP